MDSVILSDRNSIKADMEKELGNIPDEVFNEAINDTLAGVKMSFMFNKCLTLDDTERLIKAGFPVVEPLGDYMDRIASKVSKQEWHDSKEDRQGW